MSKYLILLGLLAVLVIFAQAPVSFAQIGEDYIDERIKQSEKSDEGETALSEDLSDTEAKSEHDEFVEELKDQYGGDKALYQQRKRMRQMDRMRMMDRGRE